MALRRLTLLAVLAVLAATSLALAIDAPLERYRRAEGRGELATVRGRAFEERRKPSAPDVPLVGTAVSVLPQSEAWLLRLEGIKRGARDSLGAYREAATAIRRSREAYEKSLLEAGGGDLSQTVTVDPEGGFSFDGLPAGPWILFAARSTYVSRTPQQRAPPPGGAPARPLVPQSPFLPIDKLAGYHVVTYWLRALTVSPAAAGEPVELTDRNIWFTGVIESRDQPRQPDQPYNPPR
jgi:hypothetical protein